MPPTFSDPHPYPPPNLFCPPFCCASGGLRGRVRSQKDDDKVELELEWGAPLGGTGIETISLHHNDTELHIRTTLTSDDGAKAVDYTVRGHMF